MGRMVTDEQVHKLLDKRTMEQTQELLIHLGHQRQLSGHYESQIIAVDPHRVPAKTKRITPYKKKGSKDLSQKMLQMFFSVCTKTGQPIMANMASTGLPASKATCSLMESTRKIIKKPALIVADKEHFTQELIEWTCQEGHYDILVPVIKTPKIIKLLDKALFKPLWAGFAIAETTYCFDNSKNTKYRLIAQRTGEHLKNYEYTAFLTSSTKSAEQLICEEYDKRWKIEEFFSFENKIGLNRAATLNLNIRYGKLALAMIAQASTYQLRQNLSSHYKTWNAEHLATHILAWQDGDIRVKKDTIVVTLYNAPKHIDKSKYENLPNILQSQNIDPRIPWLYNFKLDFKFK